MTAEPEEIEELRPEEPSPPRRRGPALLRNGITLLVWLAGGFVAGGIVGLIVVDETDADATHPSLNAAIVLLLGSAGALVSLALVVGPFGRRRPPRQADAGSVREDEAPSARPERD